MRDNLNEINQAQISVLVKKFNNTVKRLRVYYARLINNVARSRMSQSYKVKLINQLITALNNTINQLKKKLDSDIAKINETIYSVVEPTINKNALVIGINYTGTPNQLNGCINDANSINQLLITKKYQNITLITDNTDDKPTHDNIINSFTKLLESGSNSDIIFFFYSGHGSETINLTGDEISGNDQLIVPLDLNCIMDNEFKSIIQKKLQPNVTLIALFDSCFSESVLDLKYQYVDSLNNNNDYANNNEDDTNGNVIMISGCSDTQTSADAFINNINQGALTWAFLQTYNSQPKQTWRQLLLGMRDILSENGFTQIPQLASGKLINIDTPVFI